MSSIANPSLLAPFGSVKCQNATPAHITNMLTCHADVSDPWSTAGCGSAREVASAPAHHVNRPSLRWTALTRGRAYSGTASSSPSRLNATAPIVGDMTVRTIVRSPSLPWVVVKWGLPCIALLR